MILIPWLHGKGVTTGEKVGNSRAEAEVSMKRAEGMFRDAGMELHKLRLSGDEDADANVLGLLWNPARTTSRFECLPCPSRPPRGSCLC